MLFNNNAASRAQNVYYTIYSRFAKTFLLRRKWKNHWIECAGCSFYRSLRKPPFTHFTYMMIVGAKPHSIWKLLSFLSHRASFLGNLGCSINCCASWWNNFRAVHIYTQSKASPHRWLWHFFCKHTSSLCILTLCAERYIEMAGRKASLCRLFMIAHIRARGGRYEKQNSFRLKWATPRVSFQSLQDYILYIYMTATSFDK